MKKFFALAAVAALALPALAGDDLAYSCRNDCPLAKQANWHRSYGSEAATSSLVVLAELSQEVEANLARI